MSVRNVIPAILAAAVLVVVVLVATGGGDDNGYRFKIEMDNALGLRNGSLVTVGGVQVGKVDVDLEKDKGDKVLVTAKLDHGQGPIGRGARAYVTSVNLLGQKRLELDKGDLAQKMPSGSVIAASRVTPSTDLDEVLAVLTPDVRQRLNIMLDEAGAAVVGRKVDISQLIGTLPSTIEKADQVVNQVTGDTNTLAELVEHSDKVVGDVTAERAALADLIDSAGQAAGSAADKRAQLRATLARAPGMLSALRGFLTELRETTVPLGPAARDIKDTAPELLATLNQLAPFQQAAAPTLRQATDVAPSLTKLAKGSTPVLKQATPVLQRASAFSTDLVPVSDTLNKSADNLVGTVDNWSRAVQYRDNIGHIFRGELGITPQTLEGMMLRYLGKGAALPTSTKAKKQAAKGDGGSTGGGAKDAPKLDLPKVAKPVKEVVDGVLGALGGTVDSTVKGLLSGGKSQGPAPGSGEAPKSATQSLLDFLLKP